MNKQPLTARQQQVFDYITWFRDTNGIAPTIREIGEHMNITSPNGVMVHIRALHKKGWIERMAGGVSRGIAIAGEQLKHDYRGVLKRLVDSISLNGTVEDRDALTEARRVLS